MISFPWAIEDFFAGLRVASITFALPEALRQEETQGGEIITAALGQRLWGGTITLTQGYHDDIAATDARLSILREAGRSFLVYPRHKEFPRADPGGAILGASAPIIHALPSAREIQISGLPSGYVISPGDFLSFAYGTSPVRQALHQVVVGATASAGGVTPALEVTPAIRPGAAVGAALRLVRPFCKAVFVPGSYREPAFAARLGSGPSFSFRQTLG